MFTQYLVSLRVYNPEGAGPDTIVVVMTDEGGQNTPLLVLCVYLLSSLF